MGTDALMNTQVIKSVIGNLAKRRPIFHSEADLQFEFAWELATRTGLTIRLEVPTPRVGEIDRVIPQPATVIEFKYKTSQVQMIVGREAFHLSQHAAQPLGRYDVLKDLWRIEKAGLGGYVFFLTNDPSYWRPCKNGNGSDFSLEQGRQLHGRMSWKNTSNKKSLGRKRTAPVNIAGRYCCDWHDYSFGGQFRYLLFTV